MARIRSKPDFTAGVVLWDDERQVRALEIRVKSDDLYVLQPRRGKVRKVSYHESGQFHYKIGESAPILPIIELPPRFLKEAAFPLMCAPRRLFATSLENLPTLLQYTGQPYDWRIEIHLPKADGLLVLELYTGTTSGKRWMYEEEGYVEATVTERSFAGGGYDFCVRLALLSSTPVYKRTLDEEVSAAWRVAADDLGIRVIAPLSLVVPTGESLLFEAHIVDFGGPKGMAVGVLGRDHVGDIRTQQGYACTHLSEAYRKYKRELFVDTLNDWQWFGEKGKEPSWYTGKAWA